ncbi:hypothetical protein M947_02150 [Sulfurimonas hongkongensis]|uniref:Uncharacterized protein n=1 Tax=Sulfurimonas hongkongensis TaxID=1172190 RepID=T0JR31_9BACT|nr:hypothetical protein [Sulfurimonas hongkongensis]EQB40631.1 hypothetical protein M947_02150 [Sulfurimonas hongkongensis]
MKLQEEIINIIQENKNLVEYKNNQIIILKKRLRDSVYKIIDDTQDAKEVLRFSIKKALQLKQSDIVVIKKDHIFIKIFDIEKKKKITKSDANTVASRFNGIDESELKEFYKEFFSKAESRKFFNLIVKEFTRKFFLEEKIDNDRYEKFVFSYVQAIIMQELVNEFDHCEEFLRGFSGYIFRIHFNEVFEGIAEFMLYEISRSNDYMVEFLKYYSLNIIIVDGYKYKVPLLLTEEGMKWNVVSMLSVAKVYIRTKISIKEIKEYARGLDKRMQEFFVDGISPVDYNKKCKDDRKKLTELLRAESRVLQDMIDDIYGIKDPKEKEQFRIEIDEQKQEIKDIKKTIENILAKEIKRGTLEKYLKLEREMDSILRDIKAQEKILKQNTDSYLSIKKSLVKALISKKQRI